MRNLTKVFLLIFVCTCAPIYADMRTITIEKNYTENSVSIEEFLKTNAKHADIMTFTRVPRGLIVSIDEKYLFNKGSSKLKQSGIPVLNDILQVLKHIGSRCVIEGHSEKNSFENRPYKSDWELSLLRADNVVKYFILYGGIDADRLFSLGFGEYMPSVDNVDEKMNINSRIDFVFLDYGKNTRQ